MMRIPEFQVSHVWVWVGRRPLSVAGIAGVDTVDVEDGAGSIEICWGKLHSWRNFLDNSLEVWS